METPRWEYEVFTFEVSKEGFIVRPKMEGAAFRDQLNAYGLRGWELVSTFDINMLQGGTKQVVATFKRPLATDDKRASDPPPLP